MRRRTPKEMPEKARHAESKACLASIPPTTAASSAAARVSALLPRLPSQLCMRPRFFVVAQSAISHSTTAKASTDCTTGTPAWPRAQAIAATTVQVAPHHTLASRQTSHTRWSDLRGESTKLSSGWASAQSMGVTAKVATVAQNRPILGVAHARSCESGTRSEPGMRRSVHSHPTGAPRSPRRHESMPIPTSSHTPSS